MKQIVHFLFLLFSFSSMSQNAQFGMFVPTDIPNKNLMPKMGTNVGFGISGGYSPFFGAPIYIELKSSWGTYSHRTLQQTYMFSDSTMTNVDVNYKSSLNKFILGTKFMIGRDFHAVRAYVTPQIGLTKFKTNIVVMDPQDEDECRALDRKTTQKDIGFVYGGEAGVEISMDRIFKKIEVENKHKIVLSANYLAGFDHFEYVNIRYMTDEIHSSNVSHGNEDINATFINVSTNALHEHKIAELYHTPLRFFGINVGYIVNF